MPLSHILPTDLTYTVPSRETNTQFYGLYQTCTHSTLYSEHVRNAAKGVCTGVYVRGGYDGGLWWGLFCMMVQESTPALTITLAPKHLDQTVRRGLHGLGGAKQHGADVADSDNSFLTVDRSTLYLPPVSYAQIAFGLYLGTNGTTKVSSHCVSANPPRVANYKLSNLTLPPLPLPLSPSQLPSGERAWTLLAKAHGLCTLALLLALVAGSAIFHDLKDVLSRNLTPSVQEGKLDLSWGFAFNILAMLSHLLVVLVLVSLSPGAGPTGAGNGGGRGDAAAPSAPPAKDGGLKAPLLDVEEGGV